MGRIVLITREESGGSMRSIPSNCEVVHIPFCKNRFNYIVRGLFNSQSTGLLACDFFRNKVFLSPKKFHTWVSAALYLNNFLNNNKLQTIIKSMEGEDVCYFYWGVGQSMLSTLLKGRIHLVSRFHGEGDLWEEKYGGFQPLRTEISASLDKAVFISRHGESYFKRRYPKTSTAVFPLGSKDYGLQKPNPNDGVFRVVSCSTVYPLKRVPLIFEALNNFTDLPIEWTHIGSGTHFDMLQEKIKNEQRNHLQVNLLGMMSHDEVMNYYKNHHFDLFVNMSTSEGVPVSIMEAMSFGIPILATDVGSTSEEVDPCVGELLTPNPTIEEIICAIRKILRSTYTPREFWINHYNAEMNYSAFADMLVQLSLMKY